MPLLYLTFPATLWYKMKATMTPKTRTISLLLQSTTAACQIDKIKQQMLFFEDVTLNDMNIDEDHHLIALTVNSTSHTIVQDIKGVKPCKIGAKVLRQICVILKVQSYNRKPKAVMLDMIGQRKKNQHLELKMYCSNFEEMPAATTDDGKKQPKQREETRPREVQEDGSLYCLVLTFFLQKHRSLVTQIGTNPSAAQLGGNKFLLERVYNILSASYNDKDEANISSMNIDEDTYTAAGLTKPAPSQFDRMTGALFLQTLDFINKQYKLVYEKSKRSGHHRNFACYCTGTPQVLLYHKHLIETGDSTLQDLVVADLDKDAKRGFIGNTPTQKWKSTSVASSRGSPPTPKLPLDRFDELTEERYAKLAALNQLKTKRSVGLKMEGNALSVYSNYRDMLLQERKRLKEDYRSDGSETAEIRTAMALCREQMKVARASISAIATDEQKPAAVIMNEQNRTSSTASSSNVVFEECSLDDGEEEDSRRNAFFQV